MTKLLSIGRLAFEDILVSARRHYKLGGTPVPTNPCKLTELLISGPDDIRNVTKELSSTCGAILFSSGGTTGTPKLTYGGFHLALDRLLKQWKPLTRENVMLNLFNPGRLWASHYYMQALAEKCKCTVIPSGSFNADEIENWLPILASVKTDTLAGTPTGLYEFAEGVLKFKPQNLHIRKIIWMAEPWTPRKLKITQEAFPLAEMWGNYGSVETFVIGINTPACDISTFHLMPDQMLEIDDDGALLTRIGEGWTMPTIRYRLGDKLKAAQCRCGGPRALIVESRTDDIIILRSILFSVNQLINITRSVPGVDEVQIIVTRDEDTPKSASAIVINVSGDTNEKTVRKVLLDNFYHLSAIVKAYPDSLKIEFNRKLERIDRTNKIPSLVWKL